MNDFNVKLTKLKCKREGYEKYVDIFVEWERDGHHFQIRVQPVFNSEFRFLLAHAEEKE